MESDSPNPRKPNPKGWESLFWRWILIAPILASIAFIGGLIAMLFMAGDR